MASPACAIHEEPLIVPGRHYCLIHQPQDAIGLPRMLYANAPIRPVGPLAQGNYVAPMFVEAEEIPQSLNTSTNLSPA
jgi:hypothetical protein